MRKRQAPEWVWCVVYFVPLPCFLLPPWWLIVGVVFAAMAHRIELRGEHMYMHFDRRSDERRYHRVVQRSRLSQSLPRVARSGIFRLSIQVANLNISYCPGHVPGRRPQRRRTCSTPGTGPCGATRHSMIYRRAPVPGSERGFVDRKQEALVTTLRRVIRDGLRSAG